MPQNNNDINPITGLPYKQPSSNTQPLITSPNEQQVITTEPASSFKDYGVSLTRGNDVEEARAQAQPASEKWGHGLVKMAGLAGTTFLDGTVGTIAGLGNIAAQGNGNAFIDNPISNALLDANDWMEKQFPNYRTHEEQNNPFYKNLGTANFWSDDILKNFGFAIGAFGSGLVTAGLSEEALGSKVVANRIAKSLIANGIEDSGEVAKAIKAIQTGDRTGISYLQDGSKILDAIKTDANALRRATIFNEWAGSIGGSVGESRLESLGDSRDFKANELKSLQDKYGENIPQEELNNLEERTKAYQNTVFGLNMAVLTATEYTQFSDAFKGNYAKNKDLLGKITGGLLEGYEAKETSALTKALKVLKNPIAEGTQEQLQYTIQKAADSFYAKRWDNNGKEVTNDYLQSFVQGLSEAYGTSEGWEQFFSGAIIGAIGMPNFGKLAGGHGPNWAGGVYQDYKELKETDANTANTVTNLNTAAQQILSNKDFVANYENLVRISSLNEQSKQALLKGDKFDYKNKEEDKFLSNTLSFYNTGKLEDLVSFYDGMKQKSVTGIRESFKGEDGKSPFDSMTDSEVKTFIDNRADQLKNKTLEIRNIKEDIDTKFNGTTDAYREELTHYAYTIKDVDKRIKELHTNINNALISTTRPEASNLAQEIGDSWQFSYNPVELNKILQSEEGFNSFKQNIEKYAKENPQDNSIIEDANDLIKLAARRKHFTDLYLSALTSKGEEKVNKNIEESVAKTNETQYKAYLDNINTSIDGNTDLTSIKAFDTLKSSIEQSGLTDGDKKKLLSKIDKKYTDKLKEEKKDAPQVNSIKDLDLRYENRPLLLEHELKQASEKEGQIFNTLEEYKTYLEKNQKTFNDTTASENDNNKPKPKEKEVKETKVTLDEPKPVQFNSKDTVAIVNDMAMWEFKTIIYNNNGDVDPHATKITVLNLNNTKTVYSLEEFTKKYSLTESMDTWKVGMPFTLKDLENNPIPSTLNDSEVDLDYLRSGKLQVGDTIHYEVDREYNKTKLPENFRTIDSFKVLLVKYDNNERKVVGVLPAFKGNKNDLLELRRAIWKELQDTKGGDNIFQFSKSTKVKENWSGKFWNTGTINNPRKVLTDKQPYILGIAARGADKKLQLIAGFTDDENSRQLKTPDGENIFIKEEDGSALQLTDGAVYQIIKGLDNKWYAYKTFTNKIKDIPGLKKEILEQLNQIKNKEDYQRIKPILDDFYVKFEFTVTENPEDSSKIFNFKPEDSPLQTALSAEELYDLADLDNQRAQVKAYRENTPYLGASVQLPTTGESVDYNEWIADKGYIYTDLNPYQHFHSAKFTIEPYESNKTKKEFTAQDFEVKNEDVTTDSFDDTTGDNFHIVEEITFNQEEPKIEDIPEDLGEPVKRTKKKFKPSIFKPEYTTWNETQETEWFKKNFNVPMHVLDDLRKIHQTNINAQGLFYNSAVYIQKNAGEGTTYHEAFHVVFNMYLNPSQQKVILDEAKDKYGLKTASNEQIEERLSDEFMTYVLTEQEDKTWSGKIKNFFKRLLEFIKFYTNNKVDIDTLFYRANQGIYKNVKFNRNIDNISPRFRATNLSPNEEFQAVRMLRNLANEALREMVDNYPELSVKEVYSKAFDRKLKSNVVLDAYKQLYHEVYSKDSTGKVYVNQEYRDKPEKLNKIKEVLDKLYSNGELGPLYNEVVRSFRALGIKINDIYDSYSEDAEIYEEETREHNYSMSTAQSDPSEKLSDRIRMWLNDVPNITKWEDSDNYETTYNMFGYPDALPDNEVFNYLLENVSNSLSVDDMMSKLEDLKENKLWINKVIDDLNNDKNLRTDLLQIAQNVKTGFIFASQNNKGEFIISNSNAQGINRKILTDLNANFNSKNNILLKEDGSINIKTAQKALSNINEIKGKLTGNEEELKKLSDTLNNTGFVLNGAIISSIAANKKLYKLFIDNLSKIYTRIESGKNPFVNIIEEEDSDAFSSLLLKNLANIIKKAYPTYYQGTHINTENNKVYNHIRSSFLGKTINILTHEDSNVRNSFIESYLNTAFYRSSILLNDLYDKKQQSYKQLSFNIFDGLKRQNQDKGVPYDKMSSAQLNVSLLNSFFNNKRDIAFYGYPVLSDTGNLVMLSWKKYNKVQALEGLYQSALQEWNRIQETNKPNIKNYNKNSDNFVTFSYLNSHKSLFEDLVVNKNKIKGIIEKYMDSKVLEPYKDNLREWGVIENDENGKVVIKDKQVDKRVGDINNFIESFVYSDTLMQFQFASLLSGDAAFYKDSEDYFKRNKQVWSPGTALDVTQLDRTSYKIRVIKDEEGSSRFADKIEENLLKTGLNKDIVAVIVKQYKEGVNQTDAQSYIDIYSYKQRMKGLARWTEREENAYRNIIEGNAKPSDYVILQPIKPFVFTHILENNTIVPLQLKDSELLLIPQFVQGSEKLEKMMTQMGYTFENGQYKGFDESGRTNGKYDDQILFESAVKVGLGEITNWDKIEDSKSYTIDYSDYRVQQETPIHHQDDENLFGTQIRKLILGDIDYNTNYALHGKDISGKELISLFNDVLNKEIESSYGKILEDLDVSNFNTLIDKIKQEVLDRGMPKQYLEALETTNGKTTLPLWHPLISYKVETLLNSIVKNNGTKLKFNGGSFYNASSFGLDDKLDLVFNEDGSINYFEVMMPAWSKDFIKYFTDKDGNLDLNKLEESGLDTGITYRIPTENKYSMFRIKVKGFTPDVAGGAILMPDLVTKIAGLDFDIDKVYAMLYNHKIEGGKVVKIQHGVETKEERQNYLLDIMTSVLTNKATVQQQLTPGGFETLKGLVSKWEEYVKGDKNLDYFSPVKRTEVFNNVMTGNNLIGIFANSNATHALFQHAGSTLEFVEPILFDDNALKSLRTFKDITGNKNVSDNIAEFLAASVDNAKDPIASYLNINTYTADIINQILHVGYPIETAMAFINQPVIRRLTQLYFNESGKMSEKLIIGLAKSEFLYKIKDSKRAEKIIDNNKTKVFSTEDLKANIKYIDNYDKAPDEFYLDQVKIIELFEDYKKSSKQFSQLIRATKVADSGPGPTFADTVSKMRTLNKVNSRAFNDAIVGGPLFFKENTPNNSLYNTMIKGTMDKVFTNPDITYLFNEGIQQVLDDFESLKELDLTTDEIKQIQNNIISFLATGFETYSNEDSKNIVTKTPEKLLEYKNTLKGNSKYEPFLAYLRVVKNETSTKLEIPYLIEFDGNTGANEYVQEVIMQTWEEMLEKGDNEEKKLAEDLVRYTFYSSGFNFTPFSFYHIVPVSFFRNLTNENKETFESYLEKKIEETKESFREVHSVGDRNVTIIKEGNGYLNNFKEQFIRNYFPKLSYIKKAIFDNKNKVNVSKIEYSKYQENKPTKDAEPVKITIEGQNLYTSDLLVNNNVPDYIKHTYENKSYLFKLTTNVPFNLAEYTRIEPLGFKVKGAGSLEFDINNEFPESKWSFNKSKNNSNSIVKDNKNDVSLQTRKNPFEITDEDLKNLPNIDKC